MENSRCSLLDDKRFKEELDECYFHPSRKYASEEIKFIARNAMLLLWDMDGISVQGVLFSKSDIRYRMLHEMSCDDPRESRVQARAVPRSSSHLRNAGSPIRNGCQNAREHDRS